MARYPSTRPQQQDPSDQTTTVNPAPPPVAPTGPIAVVTDAESNLIRMANQADSFNWDKAMSAIETLDDYSFLQDPFEIPMECRLREEKKEFRYRWLDPKDQDRFVMQTAGRFPWVLATRNNAPYIPDHLRDENGLVRRAGLVLALMRYDVYMARQTRIWKLSETTEKKGPANAQGLEYTGTDGGKIRAGDIVTAQETDNRQFSMGDRVFSGDSEE